MPGDAQNDRTGKNRGEWSEIYVFLKVLNDKRLYEGDKHMNKKEDCYLEVREVIRDEGNSNEYRYTVNGDQITITCNREFVEEYPSARFGDIARKVWLLIEKHTSTTFTDEEVTDFLDSIFVKNITSPAKQKSTSFGGTKDITIEVRNSSSGSIQTLSFSIKSNLATLFNASGDNTNFKYAINGKFDDDMMLKFNSLFDARGRTAVKERMRYLKSHLSYDELEYVGPVKPAAKYNLTMGVGEEGPAIVGEMLKLYFFEHEGATTNVYDVRDELAAKNPRGYDYPDKQLKHLYSRKIADMLSAMFNGMRFGDFWDGRTDVSGGYIVVKRDSEIVFHANNSSDFTDYLMENTRFETPKCSRHHCMDVYKEDGRYCIKFPLQLRFKKNNDM